MTTRQTAVYFAKSAFELFVRFGRVAAGFSAPAHGPDCYRFEHESGFVVWLTRSGTVNAAATAAETRARSERVRAAEIAATVKAAKRAHVAAVESSWAVSDLGPDFCPDLVNGPKPNGARMAAATARDAARRAARHQMTEPTPHASHKAAKAATAARMAATTAAELMAEIQREHGLKVRPARTNAAELMAAIRARAAVRFNSNGKGLI